MRKPVLLALTFALCQSALAEEFQWKKSAANPVLSLSGEGEFDSHNLLAPAVAKRGNLYYMFYCGGAAGPLTGEDFVRYQLGLATSTDGVNFTKHGKPLLPLGDRDDFHCTPTLLRDANGDLLLQDGKWMMAYNANRADDVDLATSTDGTHWQKHPASPIYRNAYAPNLLKVGNEYWLFHVAKPEGGSWEIHAARGTSLTSLKPVANNPVLKKSQAWESNNLFYPYVLQEQGRWTMYYAGYWNHGEKTPTKTAIGSATSEDGLHWQKNKSNPVLTPQPDSKSDSVYNSCQAVIRDGDTLRMYYSGRIDRVHKYYSINLAIKPIAERGQE